MIKPAILVFAYHEIGYECLDALIWNDEYILGVITHQDNPNEKIWFRSVAGLAVKYGIPVSTPETVNTREWINRIRAWKPDIIFSFYYRNMIKEEILQIPRLGSFNMHGSLLPRYRGRVPINWAVLHGETETGVTLHHMVKHADAGDIVDQEKIMIGPEDTSYDVFNNAVPAARKLLERQLDAITLGTAPRRRQDESQATYFGGRKPEDGRIDWPAGAETIYNLVRAVTHPYPGAFTYSGGKKLFIWSARLLPEITGKPGELISTNPFKIAAGGGGLEIRKFQWEDRPEEDGTEATGLEMGGILGD